MVGRLVHLHVGRRRQSSPDGGGDCERVFEETDYPFTPCTVELYNDLVVSTTTLPFSFFLITSVRLYSTAANRELEPTPRTRADARRGLFCSRANLLHRPKALTSDPYWCCLPPASPTLRGRQRYRSDGGGQPWREDQLLVVCRETAV